MFVVHAAFRNYRLTLAQIYNHAHNILRLLDILANFSFTTSEMMRD